jgi:hypothetical protein
MTSFIDNFVERYILDKQLITDFYYTLITHYHCIDDFKLNTNYSILMFKELLFKDQDNGFIQLQSAYYKECGDYRSKLDSGIIIFDYACTIASAYNDVYGLRLLVADFRANTWSRIAAYYICHKANAMLSDPEDYSNIKKKIYAIICSIIDEEKEKKEDKEQEDEECSICLQSLKCEPCFTTLCRHTFHTSCFNSCKRVYLEQDENDHKTCCPCPLCRANC